MTTIQVTWKRDVYADAGFTRLEDTESYRVPDGQWHARDGKHYVTFAVPDGDRVEATRPRGRAESVGSAAGEGATDATDGRDRLTLRLSPSRVQLVRHGSVAWSHAFTAGETAESRLHVGGFALSVITHTLVCETALSEAAGKVFLAYQAEIGGDRQYVRLEMVYGSEL